MVGYHRYPPSLGNNIGTSPQIYGIDIQYIFVIFNKRTILQ